LQIGFENEILEKNHLFDGFVLRFIIVRTCECKTTGSFVPPVPGNSKKLPTPQIIKNHT